MDETVVKRIKSPDALTKGSNLDDDGDGDGDKDKKGMLMRMVMVMVRRRMVMVRRRRKVVTFHPPISKTQNCSM